MTTESEKAARQTRSSVRRKGARSSEVRLKLIELAQKIVESEGSAAVTAGRLAKEVGLGRHIIHYYFGTIDELLVEVIRRSGEQVLRHYEALLETENPIRVIWNTSAPVAPLVRETVALASRSEIVRAEVERNTRLVRALVTQSLERYLERRGFRPNVPPAAIAMTVLSISQALASETALGVSDGHEETEELVNGWIEAFEMDGHWPTGA